MNSLLFADAASYRRAVVLLSTVGGIMALSVVVFACKCVLTGRIRDAEIDRRGSSVLLGNLARTYFAWAMGPIVGLLGRLGATPNGITIASVVPAALAGLAAGCGEFTSAGLLFLLSGACDFLDGRLARETGRSSAGGAALDSVLDRYSECALLVGIAWYYRDGWVLLAALGAITGSLFVPYIRARGEGLGIDVKVGLMQRPERVVLLGAATLSAEIVDHLAGWTDRSPRYLLVAAALTLLTVSTHVTALVRLRHVVRTLDARTPPT